MFALKLVQSGAGAMCWCWCNPVSSFDSEVRSKIRKTLDDDYDADDDGDADNNGGDDDDDYKNWLVRPKIK